LNSINSNDTDEEGGGRKKGSKWVSKEEDHPDGPGRKNKGGKSQNKDKFGGSQSDSDDDNGPKETRGGRTRGHSKKIGGDDDLEDSQSNFGGGDKR